MSVTINGIDCDPGCWVDGHWGQYGPDHMADLIDALRLIDIDPLDDPRVLREIAEMIEGWGYPRDPTDMGSEGVGIISTFWEIRLEATDKLVERLNEITPDGWVWDWVDGEFFLMPICDDEENCTDETCAHWAYC